MRKRLLSAAVMGTVLALAPGCERPGNQHSAESRQELTNNVVLSHLAQPHFISNDFSRQVTGTDANLEVYDLNEGMVYFSIPADSFDKETTLARLTEDTSAVEFATLEDRKLKLGIYSFSKPGNFFLRFPADDFQVDSARSISVPFQSAQYNITLDELVDFTTNESIFGGKLKAITGRDRTGKALTIANHGAFVARPNEPSLTRLVEDLTSTGETPEVRAQKLLDFVTMQIAYGGGDDIKGREVLKRPDEILFTKASDCSGKVILYSSFLEQADIDYRLAYFPSHIAVAVQGEFPDRNGLTFSMDGKPYSIAETTNFGFKIGETRLDGLTSFEQIDYIQDPGRYSKIIDVDIGKPLDYF